MSRTTTNLTASPQRQTAQQLFSAWSDSKVSVRCQDLSYLYVALARALGLRSFFVQVDEDCYGTRGLHSCAAVFVNGKAVLVDPTYSWFGVPHVKFTILDDLQTAATHLCVGGNLAECQVAAKLATNVPIVQANLFNSLADAGRWDEAEQHALALAKLDPDSPLALWARAETVFHKGRADEAVTLMQKAIAIAPRNDVFHLALARMYQRQGNLTQAKTAYESACRWSIDGQSAQEAKLALAQIDAWNFYNSGREQEVTGDWNKAFSAYDSAIRLEPDFAEPFFVAVRCRTGGGISTQR